MNNPEPQEVTRLLLAWRNGDAAALEQLMPLVEAELRRLAHSCLRQERNRCTLQTDMLVNEAYLRLINVHQIEWQDRVHFFSFVAMQMRRIIIDLARSRLAMKRGDGQQPEELDELQVVTQGRSLGIEDLLALDEALKLLAQEDARSCRVVEMRFFAGLTFEEIAEIEGVSTRTLKDDWSFAKAWLRRALAGKSKLDDVEVGHESRVERPIRQSG
jgi:RNA polymerase sigma factor (TIGR02999 family)